MNRLKYRTIGAGASASQAKPTIVIRDLQKWQVGELRHALKMMFKFVHGEDRERFFAEFEMYENLREACGATTPVNGRLIPESN